MAIATSSSSLLFTSPNLTFNSYLPSKHIPSSVTYKRTTVTASYATAERPTTVDTRTFRTGSSSSLYDVLGVGVGADMREIKSAYRRLARVLHPDVGNGDSSADEFMKVHLAYSTLVDPENRSLVQRRMGGLSPVRSGGGYRSRRWETDQCW